MSDHGNESPGDGLSVRRGAAAPPDVNPGLVPAPASRPSVEDLFAAVVRGDRVALGRAITLVESRLPSDRAEALELLDRCSQVVRPGTGWRIGISGAPGVGKSTFIDAYGQRLTAAGHRVAVLAVDPSSDRTGGSILGDKTRMAGLVADERAFVRPSPSSGALGGVGRFTRAALSLCEAAGYDRILVETVGVGQSEIAVSRMVDTFLLLAQAGSGDELQGMKRGIVEVAEVIVVTKADGDLLGPASVVRSALRSALSLFPPDETGWRAPVVTCSALSENGFEEAAVSLDAHRAHLLDGRHLQARRERQAVRWMHEELTSGFLDRLAARADLADAVREAELGVGRGLIHPFRAADSLLNALAGPGP